jgi:hypothetical protein
MLHAWKLSVPDPKTGEQLSFVADVPDDFKHILKLMNLNLGITGV